jgi:hypothetical protein
VADPSEYFLTEPQLQAEFDRRVRDYVFGGYTAAEGQPVLVLLGAQPAAGKSQAMQATQQQYQDTPLRLQPGRLLRPHRRRSAGPSALSHLTRRSRRLSAVRQHVAKGVYGEGGPAGPVPRPPVQPSPPYASLPRSQQQLLYALADLSEGCWNTAGDIGESLATYGLPATHAGLRAYIGLPAVARGYRPPKI